MEDYFEDYERGYTRSNRKYAATTKTYYKSLAELRRRRVKFLKSDPKVFLGKRLIAGASREFGAVECVIRVGVSSTTPYKKVLAAALTKLIEEFGHGHRFEVSFTSNAILQRIEENEVSYSLWYGQTYNAYESGLNNENILGSTYYLSTLDDLERLPPVLTYDDIWRDFARTFDEGSSVSVFELTHYVIILRRFIEEMDGRSRMIPLSIEI